MTHKEQLEILRDLERDDFGFCASCGWTPGHGSDCRLAKLMAYHRERMCDDLIDIVKEHGEAKP